ncbi:MAG: aminomethyl transferase family protein [Kordiimonadaceae bacterium]|nr:aminomethyl transferase family protein [Kordiimonadaceae bacterium]MBT6037335.1 aminomethyl transferase family protein [Kordiimonadaceae bacterium]MBT6328867.1 aminomethyl transferase family protein [Kordiimonadaceae bacterium]
MEKHDFKQVLQHTPFHVRVEELSLMKSWSPWNGYQVARVFDTLAAEYFAVRSSCTVFDVTPMEKYRIKGPDALDFLNRLVTRDVSKLKPGRVTYVAWCNDEGRVLDDGTIFHLGDDGYRLCAQHHQLDWLMISSLGFDVSIEEETHDVAALSVQGPTSYSVLCAAGISGLEELKPFGILNTKIDDVDVMVSRTGFTGDLGYEVWVDPRHGITLWDAIFSVKERGLYDIKPIGLDALEMVRIEAGFIMPGDDFITAETAVRADHDRSPFELGLEWAVSFDKPYYTGRRALELEKSQPAKRRLVKLSVEGNKEPTDSFLYDAKNGQRIGAIKTNIWSPILKSNLAMADIDYKNGEAPTEIWAEIYYQKELEWKSTWARCEISDKPFWSNKRRSQTPPNRV